MKNTQVQTRMTKQRKIILEELRKLCTHPTADELYQNIRVHIPQISLGTVYRNLDLLTHQGEILKLDTCGQKRFDGNPIPHSHIRCTQCGCVRDVHTVPAVPEAVQVVVPNFQVTATRLEFDGICDNCFCQNH